MTANEVLDRAGLDHKIVRDCLRSAGYTIIRIGAEDIGCPFKDERFDIPPDEPCPVCGMTGGINDPDYCVG